HRNIRRQRLDFAHKPARKLVRDHDLIAHEALRIANMTRSAAGTLEAPGTNVAAKAGLNRSILDADGGVFLNVLRAKAESAGRVIVEVDARHTSPRCAPCGHTAARAAACAGKRRGRRAPPTKPGGKNPGGAGRPLGAGKTPSESAGSSEQGGSPSFIPRPNPAPGAAPFRPRPARPRRRPGP